MFQFLQKQDELQCFFNENKVFSRIQVSVNLDDQSNYVLKLQTMEGMSAEDHLGKYKEYQYKYQDSLESIWVTLRFRCYESFISTFVDAAIQNEELFKKQSFFAPQQSINITILDWVEDYKIMANYQHKDWWTRPFFTNNIHRLPERTQSLLLKTKETYYHILPVCEEVTRTNLRGTETGLEISISPFHGGYSELSVLAFSMASGNDPFQLVNENIKAALTLCNPNVLPREEKKYPEILNYLGWCSWDAFYHAVNEDGILTKAEELKQKNIPVKWMMIDDGWSKVDGKKLQSFEADPEKFPKGLSNTTSILKEKFDVKWIGVWHTIAGYWEGISPTSSIAKSLNNYLYKTKNGSLIPSPKVAEGFGFWNAWHSKLKKDGIDFVKVDSQSAITNFMTANQSIGEAAGGAHEALEASCSLHFDNTVINCMGMAEENIWHRPYSAISRNSDDFVPQEENSFKEHALQNAYNSLYHGAFYWGDWDMYWTKNHDDMQNMILRVVSGGPIYFSDGIDQTNPEMIWPLVYKDGQIIRCEQPGVPTEDCLFMDPTMTNAPLKIWNRCKEAGVIAAFNIAKESGVVVGSIGPSDIPNLTGETFLVFDVLTKKHWKLNKNESIQVELEENGTSLYLIIPVQNALTPIGLLNKLVCNDGMVYGLNTEEGIKVMLKESGVFAFYSENQQVKAKVNGKEAVILQEPNNPQLYIVDCTDHDGQVLVEIGTAN